MGKVLVERYFKCFELKPSGIRKQKANLQASTPRKRLINCLVHILIKLSSWDFLCVLICTVLKKLLSSPPSLLWMLKLCAFSLTLWKEITHLWDLLWKKKKNPKQMGGHVLFSFSICLNFNCSYNYAGMYFFPGSSHAEKF